MKNQNKLLSSNKITPVILSEMENLLPLLSAEQVFVLQEDIVSNGCYSPIIVNQDMIVIDGHNRHRIYTEHNIPYQMLAVHFDDLLEAKHGHPEEPPQSDDLGAGQYRPEAKAEPGGQGKRKPFSGCAKCT